MFLQKHFVNSCLIVKFTLMNIDYDLRFSCFISITITNMQIRENKNDDEMSRYHHCGPAKSSLSRLLERIPAKIKPEKLRS